MLDKILDYLKKEIPGLPISEHAKYYILPTICHNLNHQHASNKLYLYKNLFSEDDAPPLFHCYTECNKTFNIYQLIQKREKLKGNDISLNDAFFLFHGKNYVPKKVTSKQEITFSEKFENPLIVELPTYKETILDLFPQARYGDPWHVEGIDLVELEKYEISFSKSYGGVIIPHRDYRGNLIGIRIRTLDPEKVEHFKYMPLSVNGLYCRHPLSNNFYGIYQNQNSIKKFKKAIIFESEKSVLQYETIFDGDNISLAVCGKSISQWHMNMLVYYLGVNEVLIGFDKEKDFLDNFLRLKEQLSFLTSFMRVGVLVDTENVFELKQSPVDKTAKDFSKLKIWYL